MACNSLAYVSIKIEARHIDLIIDMEESEAVLSAMLSELLGVPAEAIRVRRDAVARLVLIDVGANRIILRENGNIELQLNRYCDIGAAISGARAEIEGVVSQLGEALAQVKLIKSVVQNSKAVVSDTTDYYGVRTIQVRV